MGKVSPNPLVGAVLVHKGNIIGEGYHHEYGAAHAEVMCIEDAISQGNKDYIQESTLYVSLEPCNHFGKTPPCTQLILQYKIPHVVVAISDPFHKVNGSGIAYLRQNGVLVETGCLEIPAAQLNKRFFTFQIKKRPYIILKWAQAVDGFIGAAPGAKRLLISSPAVNTLVHKWRSEEDAILVGGKTVAVDNPMLTTRLWAGKSPLRIVLDTHSALPADSNAFAQNSKTVWITGLSKATHPVSHVENIVMEKYTAQQLVHTLWQRNIQSVLLEGGAKTVQFFIDSGLWDEARIITNRSMLGVTGVSAPILVGGVRISELVMGQEHIDFFQKAE